MQHPRNVGSSSWFGRSHCCPLNNHLPCRWRQAQPRIIRRSLEHYSDIQTPLNASMRAFWHLNSAALLLLNEFLWAFFSLSLLIVQLFENKCGNFFGIPCKYQTKAFTFRKSLTTRIATVICTKYACVRVSPVMVVLVFQCRKLAMLRLQSWRRFVVAVCLVFSSGSSLPHWQSAHFALAFRLLACNLGEMYQMDLRICCYFVRVQLYKDCRVNRKTVIRMHTFIRRDLVLVSTSMCFRQPLTSSRTPHEKKTFVVLVETQFATEAEIVFDFSRFHSPLEHLVRRFESTNDSECGHWVR